MLRKIILMENAEFAAFCLTPVYRNGEICCNASFYRSQNIVLPYQIHSTAVMMADSAHIFPEEADAIITTDPDIIIGVVTADCVPIVVYAADIKAVAAIHAGWRGTLDGVVDNTLEQLRSMGAELSKMVAIFGSSISVDCYEVDNNLANRFRDAGFGTAVYEIGGNPHLDLQQMNQDRLLRCGVIADNIRLSELSTFTSIESRSGRHLFPSYRRDNATADRLLTAIRLKS